MDTIKQAGNYVSDKVQSATHGASKEANKETAKDSNAPVGTRAEAGYDALKDKSKEHSHDAQAEANKQAATH
ncbi:putative glucose-repressible protein [Phaeoacremonium minimum UCRPA7]|uniref:Putative glucose-repressible protein n=1 Tax=Phaeoacremonium minimum (strain UCR-PA7) TaxID=1286976 RepID=R8BQ33_PHAM7|nr:putative glucose-repressible protein [Phaeoacremonium minimum UCRPA7]EOO01498.1 putative glucose-repressible protein [Phaeoacremonium minimum UCRPA7]